MSSLIDKKSIGYTMCIVILLRLLRARFGEEMKLMHAHLKHS